MEQARELQRQRRQPDGERRPLPTLALKSDRAAMQFGAVLDNLQPQPGAADTADVAGALIGFEDAFLVSRRNANPMIAHLEGNFAALAAQCGTGSTINTRRETAISFPNC